MNLPNFDFEYQVHWFNSPGYLLAKVPELVQHETIDSLQKLETGEIEKIDWRDQLKGHLKEEWKLPIKPHMSFLAESLGKQYCKEFNIPLEQLFRQYTSAEQEYKLKLKSLWVNYGQKYDFNPSHCHSGVFSFVIWVQIPFDLEEEMKRYGPNTNETALFYFTYISPLGKHVTDFVPVTKDWEWRMAFFPSGLNHGVNPYYTSDDYRISISGNMYLEEFN